MKLVVDMNLSPAWAPVLQAAGHEVVHWSTVGDPRVEDREIMAWARQNGSVVFTNDLDFGALLAVTGAEGPSVIQIRATDVTPEAQSKRLLGALEQFKESLSDGALVSIDESRERARLLPLK
jgi:predicted nuclease of predicted toxin-antitoxin system